ncbi:glycosyltransferase [Synechococcus sp. A10-1-5-1]|uniref:glycosyltransferase family 2 protein n=1 Tax=Synechococcus sp. A10-1-5-1 TaxID=2936507 RepID=UPI0020008884|nr:glycosyltransferase [Synechococcus sp. A10-1-5-1]UPM49219.1 glycosyltransferase [Synechococcus sp. A10-1-5-1]
MSDLITIVLPVYGRPELLREAFESVYLQDDPDWRLLIADDGSDAQTAELIQQQRSDSRVKVVRRPTNLGLFGNLNAAIDEVETPWQLILCSDDCLEHQAIGQLKKAISSAPEVSLMLSSYHSIDANGDFRTDVNGAFYDRFAPITRLFEPGALLQPLLQYGSINGNITGLLIRQSLFRDAGPWRADWSQSADWEWLIRASSQTSVLLRREPIARVRVHEWQLSVSNRKLQRENLETLEVLSGLLRHPQLQSCGRRRRWAAHHAQFLLWNVIKALPRFGIKATVHQLALIQRHVGLVPTAFALLSTLPMRFRIRGTDRPLLPPT